MTRTNQHTRKRLSFDERFNRIKSRYGFGRGKISITERSDQIEFAYLVNKIESYGFRFFPDVYIREDLYKLERLCRRYNNNNYQSKRVA